MNFKEIVPLINTPNQEMELYHASDALLVFYTFSMLCFASDFGHVS
jgi:hypothetical protein